MKIAPFQNNKHANLVLTNQLRYMMFLKLIFLSIALNSLWELCCSAGAIQISSGKFAENAHTINVVSFRSPIYCSCDKVSLCKTGCFLFLLH
jgi:hypothetical protein